MTSEDRREFVDVRKADAAPLEGKPVDDFMAELEAIQERVMTDRNRVWEHVADGTLSEEYLRRFCKEYWWLGVYYTAEFGTLVSQAPDVHSVNMATSQHFRHWVQNLADETGFAGDPNHVDMKVDWARMIGIGDDELVTYEPLPETVGSVFTTCYYIRRSYEEGLAAFGWAGERFAASTGYAKMMYEGLRDHYGMEVENFHIHAYAEADHGDAADYLLRQVALTADQQRRIAQAISHTFLVRNARNKALNAWLDQPGALR